MHIIYHLAVSKGYLPRRGTGHGPQDEEEQPLFHKRHRYDQDNVNGCAGKSPSSLPSKLNDQTTEQTTLFFHFFSCQSTISPFVLFAYFGLK
jgi:hypothetical protein